jgi:hypothetical protein
VDISFNGANLSWIPGFDGGEAQSFSVKVLNEEGAIINTFKVNGETGKDTTIYHTFLWFYVLCLFFYFLCSFYFCFVFVFVF